MKVEISIAKEKAKAMPKGAIDALRVELKRRLDLLYPDVDIEIKIASNDGLTLFRALDKDDARKQVEAVLQNTWESADDWFYA